MILVQNKLADDDDDDDDDDDGYDADIVTCTHT